MQRYDISTVERIYGVEPNADLHDALRSNVKKHRLSDVYTIVPCGVEDLEKLREYGIEAGSMDTVMSVQVLCSVPKPEALAKDLYRLLKPGGQMIVYEHVKSEDYVSHLVQCLYSPFHRYRARADITQCFTIWSGLFSWAIVTWIVQPGSICSRLAVGLRSNWICRKRMMLGWYFRMCLGGLSSGVPVKIEAFE